MEFRYVPGEYFFIITTSNSSGRFDTHHGICDITGDEAGITHDKLLECLQEVIGQNLESAHYTLIQSLRKRVETGTYVLNLTLYDWIDEETSSHVFYTVLSPERSIATALSELLDIMSNSLVVAGFAYARL
ncbi:MAG: hypothetical protein WBP12_03485 [Candidatus Saccharimonas sp.]